LNLASWKLAATKSEKESMCFSATASFTSAAVLIPMGAYCCWRAVRKHPWHWPFAVIPFGFSIQQAAEGVVWLSLAQGRPDRVSAATGVYLFFALAWWPFWFPVAAGVAVRSARWRWVFVVWAVFSTGWFLFAYLPAWADSRAGLRAEVVHHSIHYRYADEVVFAGRNFWPLTALYCWCAAGPLLVLGKRVYVVPAVGGGACVAVAWLVYAHAYISVWCFFAGILSWYNVYFFATAPAEKR
jgi:hypothetical protein